MVKIEDIKTVLDNIINKNIVVDEKCQPDYITSLPYANAKTVEEVDKRLTAIEDLINAEHDNITDNTNRINELDDELSEIYKENQELEESIEENQGIIDDFHEYAEQEMQRNNELIDRVLDDLPYSYVPEEWAEELNDVLTSGIFNDTGDEYIDSKKKDTIMEIVNRIEEYADDIRPTVPDYMTNQDVTLADSMIDITSQVEDIINPSFMFNSKKEDSDKAEIELGELIESRGLNEARESEINLQQNKLLSDNDKSERKINKLSDERDKQERKRTKLEDKEKEE